MGARKAAEAAQLPKGSSTAETLRKYSDDEQPLALDSEEFAAALWTVTRAVAYAGP